MCACAFYWQFLTWHWQGWWAWGRRWERGQPAGGRSPTWPVLHQEGSDWKTDCPALEEIQTHDDRSLWFTYIYLSDKWWTIKTWNTPSWWRRSRGWSFWCPRRSKVPARDTAAVVCTGEKVDLLPRSLWNEHVWHLLDSSLHAELTQSKLRQTWGCTCSWKHRSSCRGRCEEVGAPAAVWAGEASSGPGWRQCYGTCSKKWWLTQHQTPYQLCLLLTLPAGLNTGTRFPS